MAYCYTTHTSMIDEGKRKVCAVDSRLPVGRNALFTGSWDECMRYAEKWEKQYQYDLAHPKSKRIAPQTSFMDELA